MKKTFIVVLALFVTAFISSCTKDNSVKPANAKVLSADGGTLGSGDGTPP